MIQKGTHNGSVGIQDNDIIVTNDDLNEMKIIRFYGNAAGSGKPVFETLIFEDYMVSKKEIVDIEHYKSDVYPSEIIQPSDLLPLILCVTGLKATLIEPTGIMAKQARSYDKYWQLNK